MDRHAPPLEPKPLEYGPDVYRAYDKVCSYVRTWLHWAALQSEHLARQEGSQPGKAEIQQLASITTDTSVWLFTRTGFHELHVELWATKVEKCEEWARGIPSRMHLTDLVNRLYIAIAAHVPTHADGYAGASEFRDESTIETVRSGL